MKTWSTATADAKFSKWIRERDKACIRCGVREGLSNSHFWPRNKSALRYEPDNCITLCTWKCHIYGWEKEKQGAYQHYMKKRLGLRRYKQLERIYYQSSMTRREAIKKLMGWLKK